MIFLLLAKLSNEWWVARRDRRERERTFALANPMMCKTLSGEVLHLTEWAHLKNLMTRLQNLYPAEASCERGMSASLVSREYGPIDVRSGTEWRKMMLDGLIKVDDLALVFMPTASYTAPDPHPEIKHQQRDPGVHVDMQPITLVPNPMFETPVRINSVQYELYVEEGPLAQAHAGNVNLKRVVEGLGAWSATPAWLHPEGSENDVEALFAEYPQSGSFLAVSLDMGAEGETNYYLYVRDAEQQFNYQFLLRMFSDDNTVDIQLDESEEHNLPGATDLYSAASFLCSEQPWWKVPLTTPIEYTRGEARARSSISVQLTRRSKEQSFGIGYNSHVIMSVAPDGPSAGKLELGDKILALNGQSTRGMSHNDAIQLICGGLHVAMTVSRLLGDEEAAAAAVAAEEAAKAEALKEAEDAAAAAKAAEDAAMYCAECAHATYLCTICSDKVHAAAAAAAAADADAREAERAAKAEAAAKTADEEAAAAAAAAEENAKAGTVAAASRPYELELIGLGPQEMGGVMVGGQLSELADETVL